ncbi:hypothetical protein D3C83_11600 [compost metagenome]
MPVYLQSVTGALHGIHVGPREIAQCEQRAVAIDLGTDCLARDQLIERPCLAVPAQGLERLGIIDLEPR